MSAFHEHLVALLGSKGISARSFAKQVKAGSSFVHKVCKGERPPPAEKITAWADALQLHGAEREVFIELAWLSRSPAFVVRLVARLRGQPRK